MAVYGRTFDDDPAGLDRDDVLHRAFALGVAVSLEEPVPDGELDRLKGEVAGRYGESLVELAYDEGRTRGRSPPGEDPDAEAVWEELVETDVEELDPPLIRGGAVSRQTDLPTSIAVPGFLSHRTDALAKLGLPGFLD